MRSTPVGLPSAFRPHNLRYVQVSTWGLIGAFVRWERSDTDPGMIKSSHAGH